MNLADLAWLLLWCIHLPPTGFWIWPVALTNATLASWAAWQALPGTRQREVAFSLALCVVGMFTAGLLHIGAGYRTERETEWWVLTGGAAVAVAQCMFAVGYCAWKQIGGWATWRAGLLWLYWLSDLAVNLVDRELWKLHRSPADGLANQETWRLLVGANRWEHTAVVVGFILVWRREHGQRRIA